MKHIGLFGGTFNPIHLGHIQVIRDVKKGFGLNKIFIIPSALPPHKKQNGIVNAGDRMEMIRLAFSKYSDFVVSNVELKRSGPSYTIDTVRHFKSILPENTELYLILGLDTFLEINTWKSYKDLFPLTSFIVMSRTVTDRNSKVFKWKPLENYLQLKILDEYKFLPSQSAYMHPKKKPIYLFDVTPVDISSTKIRDLIKNGSTVKGLVPEIVEDFIKTKGLYL